MSAYSMSHTKVSRQFKHSDSTWQLPGFLGFFHFGTIFMCCVTSFSYLHVMFGFPQLLSQIICFADALWKSRVCTIFKMHENLFSSSFIHRKACVNSELLDVPVQYNILYRAHIMCSVGCNLIRSSLCRMHSHERQAFLTVQTKRVPSFATERRRL